MKVLNPRAAILEDMSHYLEGKCYQSETFISYVARGLRAIDDKFNNEDRTICKKIAKEKIEEITSLTVVKMFDVDEYPFDFILMDPETCEIVGTIDDYDIELNCEKGVEFEFCARHLSTSVSYIKKRLTKAFLGK